MAVAMAELGGMGFVHYNTSARPAAPLRRACPQVPASDSVRAHVRRL